MFRKINFVLCLTIMCFVSQNLSANPSTDEEKPKLSIPITTHTGGSKAPSRNYSIPDVYLCSSPYSLEIVQSGLENNMPFSIVSSNGVTVLTGTILFDESGLYIIDISNLNVGVYTLNLTCNGRSYSGVFEIL